LINKYLNGCPFLITTFLTNCFFFGNLFLKKIEKNEERFLLLQYSNILYIQLNSLAKKKITMEDYTNLNLVLKSGYTVDEDEPIAAIKKIIAVEGTERGAFYHLSIDDLVQRVALWRQCMPRVNPHYAVKCNNDPSVLRTFEILGLGFDCASLGEMKAILSLGVDASRIIFAHTIKSNASLRFAKQRGVTRMTVDSIDELDKIARFYPSASLVLRIRCDALEAQCPLGIKFGVLPAHARPLLQHAKGLGLNVVGVSFHVGSGCQEPAVFLRAIRDAKRIFEEAEEEGFHPTLLDIGGGFVGGRQENMRETAAYVNQALDEHFPEGCGVEVIAEPGRYMVMSAFTLATTVLNRRTVEDKLSIYVDDSLYGSFNAILYDHQVMIDPVPVMAASSSCSPLVECKVWGGTCDSIDEIAGHTRLPSAIATGDWLVWQEMGAYTLAAGSNFNGFSVPDVMPHMSAVTEMLLQKYLDDRVDQDSKSQTSSGCVSDEEVSNGEEVTSSNGGVLESIGVADFASVRREQKPAPKKRQTKSARDEKNMQALSAFLKAEHF